MGRLPLVTFEQLKIVSLSLDHLAQLIFSNRRENFRRILLPTHKGFGELV